MKMLKDDFKDGTNEIINASLEVHKRLGPGFQEVIYQRALYHEFHLREYDFDREVDLEIFYKGHKVGKRRVDFIVREIMVEIKAKSVFDELDYVQTLSYLRAAGKKVGLLLNFGSKKLMIKRFVLTNNHGKNAEYDRISYNDGYEFL